MMSKNISRYRYDILIYTYIWAFQVALMVKNLPANEGDIRVQFLGWEDPLEEKMTTNCSILAWGIPWTGEPGGLQYIGSH